MPEIPSILKRILDTKREEVEHRASRLKLPDLRARATDMPPTRGFAARVRTVAETGPAVIAEEEHDRVVGELHAFQRIDEPTHMMIHLLDGVIGHEQSNGGSRGADAESAGAGES